MYQNKIEYAEKFVLRNYSNSDIMNFMPLFSLFLNKKQNNSLGDQKIYIYRGYTRVSRKVYKVGKAMSAAL